MTIKPIILKKVFVQSDGEWGESNIFFNSILDQYIDSGVGDVLDNINFDDDRDFLEMIDSYEMNKVFEYIKEQKYEKVLIEYAEYHEGTLFRGRIEYKRNRSFVVSRLIPYGTLLFKRFLQMELLNKMGFDANVRYQMLSEYDGKPTQLNEPIFRLYWRDVKSELVSLFSESFLELEGETECGSDIRTHYVPCLAQE